MKTSIIITTLGRYFRLSIVLKALENQVDENTEVIVVFDGCDKALKEEYKKIKLKYEPVFIFLDENQGRSAARNRGIEKASGNLLIFLDDDRVPCPDFVKLHKNAQRENSVVVGGRKEIFIPKDQLEKIPADKNFKEEYRRRILQ